MDSVTIFRGSPDARYFVRQLKEIERQPATLELQKRLAQAVRDHDAVWPAGQLQEVGLRLPTTVPLQSQVFVTAKGLRASSGGGWSKPYQRLKARSFGSSKDDKFDVQAACSQVRHAIVSLRSRVLFDPRISRGTINNENWREYEGFTERRDGYADCVETEVSSKAYRKSKIESALESTGRGLMRTVTFPIWGPARLIKSVVKKYG